MDEKDSRHANATQQESWSVTGLIKKYIPTSFTELTLAGTILLGGGAILYVVTVNHDSRPLCDLLKSIYADVCPAEVNAQAQPAPPQAVPAPSGQAYIDASPSDSALDAGLLRAFHEKRLALTDNPTQAGVILAATADIAMQPSNTVGSTPIWQDTAAASVKATDARSRATLFCTAVQGHGSATRADLARQYALDDAAKHLAAEYEASINAGKSSRKQEATR